MFKKSFGQQVFRLNETKFVFDTIQKKCIMEELMYRNESSKAFAKVNFNLRVLPVREDGFHNIESIFQTVSIYDELFVTVKEEAGCEVICDSMVLPQKNTITSAYEAFCKISPVDVPGIKVVLKKGIPAGGGLGGGSSDAAALVRVLQKICNIELSVGELDYIAAQTGSDVFFFMHCDKDGKGTALVSGRGERVKIISSRTDLYLLLIFPGVGSSTKNAYSLVDDYLTNVDEVNYPSFEELESIYRLAPEKWIFKNTFYPALREIIPDIKVALEELKKTDAVYTAMSGSGSTVFGVYASQEKAITAMQKLQNRWSVKLVQTL